MRSRAGNTPAAGRGEGAKLPYNFVLFTRERARVAQRAGRREKKRIIFGGNATILSAVVMCEISWCLLPLPRVTQPARRVSISLSCAFSLCIEQI